MFIITLVCSNWVP